VLAYTRLLSSKRDVTYLTSEWYMQASGTFLRVQSYTDLFESEYYYNLLIKPLYYILIRKPLLLDMYGLYATKTGIYYRSVAHVDVQLTRQLQPYLQLQL
jgi:hypothetical protein